MRRTWTPSWNRTPTPPTSPGDVSRPSGGGPGLRWAAALGVALLVAGGPVGCGAIRGSYFLADAEQKLASARESGADQSIYYWTMAEEHMHKAYEEWGYSDFQAAEKLSIEAADYASKAMDAVTASGAPVLQDATKPKVEAPPPPAEPEPNIDIDFGPDEGTEE